jgi:YgiT-type zinc finger domain-containing protein
MKKISRAHCTGDCPGRPQLARVSQAFTRRGSQVEVIISRIPATVCPVCGHSFLEEEIAQRVEALLRPFHGTRGSVPVLPSAKVYIDFEEAGKRKKAA